MRLTGRERKAVMVGGAALLVFVVLQFIVFPLVDNRSRLKKRLVAREKAVAEMRVLLERHQRLSEQSGAMGTLLAEREEGFSLFSFLEKNADESEIKERIAYMKPSESGGAEPFKQSLVEMKLQAVPLQNLLTFLEKTESPEHLVGIDKLTIQENTKEGGVLDATLTIVSVDQVAGQAGQ